MYTILALLFVPPLLLLFIIPIVWIYMITGYTVKTIFNDINYTVRVSLLIACNICFYTGLFMVQEDFKIPFGV